MEVKMFQASRVAVTGQSGVVAGFAVVGQIFVSVIGMLAGLAAVLAGALLTLAGVTGSQTEASFSVLGAEITIETGWPGLVIAVIGALIVFFTRYEVDLGQSDDKE